MSKSSFDDNLLPVYALRVPQGWVGAAFRGQDLARLQLWEETPEAVFAALTGRDVERGDEDLVIIEGPAGGPLRSSGYPPLRRTLELLASYFAGEAPDLTEVPLALTTATPFQRAVLAAARRIPPGVTASYGELAREAGSPKAARAVGGVMASNPIPVVIPCHRVVGSTGKLTGFTGGLDKKRTLLRLEGALME